MDASEAYERRVWRVALLLTDDAGAAESILARAVRTQPDLAKIGDTRLDRMVVQEARGWGGGGDGAGLGDLVALDEGVAAVWEAVCDLGEQAREAWVFRDLEGLEAVRAARAMDCSRTALEEVHLLTAHRVLEARIGESAAEATGRLAAALAGLEESEALGGALERAAAARADVVKRRRWVSAGLLVVLLVCFGLMIFVLVSLLRWNKRNEMNQLRTDEYANPPQSTPAPGEDGSGGE